jgi:thioredoxin
MADAAETTIVTCPKCGTRNRVRKAASGYPHCQKCAASLPWIVEVDDPHFTEVVLEASVPVLVDFWAPWCGPCRVVAPVLEEIAEERPDLRIVKLNTDENQQTAAAFQVLSIPTMILFKGGQPVKTVIGAYPKKKLEQELEPALTA